jgi:hypothetical protein
MRSTSRRLLTLRSIRFPRPAWVPVAHSMRQACTATHGSERSGRGRFAARSSAFHFRTRKARHCKHRRTARCRCRPSRLSCASSASCRGCSSSTAKSTAPECGPHALRRGPVCNALQRRARCNAAHHFATLLNSVAAQFHALQRSTAVLSAVRCSTAPGVARHLDDLQHVATLRNAVARVRACVCVHARMRLPVGMPRSAAIVSFDDVFIVKYNQQTRIQNNTTCCEPVQHGCNHGCNAAQRAASEIAPVCSACSLGSASRRALRSNARPICVVSPGSPRAAGPHRYSMDRQQSLRLHTDAGGGAPARAWQACNGNDSRRRGVKTDLDATLQSVMQRIKVRAVQRQRSRALSRRSCDRLIPAPCRSPSQRRAARCTAAHGVATRRKLLQRRAARLRWRRRVVHAGAVRARRLLRRRHALPERPGGRPRRAAAPLHGADAPASLRGVPRGAVWRAAAAGWG